MASYTAESDKYNPDLDRFLEKLTQLDSIPSDSADVWLEDIDRIRTYYRRLSPAPGCEVHFTDSISGLRGLPNMTDIFAQYFFSNRYIKEDKDKRKFFLYCVFPHSLLHDDRGGERIPYIIDIEKEDCLFPLVKDMRELAENMDLAIIECSIEITTNGVRGRETRFSDCSVDMRFKVPASSFDLETIRSLIDDCISDYKKQYRPAHVG